MVPLLYIQAYILPDAFTSNTRCHSRTANSYICLPCRLNSTSTAASTASSPPNSPEPSPTTPNPPVPNQTPFPYSIHGSLLLSRAPLLTPSLHPFESAFYLYQRRLNERLALPFTQYFYYKRGTPAFLEWRAQRRARGGVATRDIGNYDAYSKEGWNDEVLVGDKTGESGEIVRQLVRDEGEGKVLGERDDALSEEEGGKGRQKDEMKGLVRDLGKEQDLKSLERQLDRTLYLVVRKGAKGLTGERERMSWGFPDGELLEKEGVKDAAVRSLHSTLGPNMNTWVVAPHPVGHFVEHYRRRVDTNEPTSTSAAAPSPDLVGTKHFFIKARILAGQAEILPDNFAGVDNFRWLSKDEIKETVGKEYWSAVKNMLVEQ
ncbi:MAG: hypothetical protein Q9227_008700 [Pyrenula ochraceoflavens]